MSVTIVFCIFAELLQHRMLQSFPGLAQSSYKLPAMINPPLLSGEHSSANISNADVSVKCLLLETKWTHCTALPTCHKLRHMQECLIH